MLVQANGINIHCKISGAQGAPWLIFSNSLATDLSMWDEQAALIGKTHRILRYDQRGHGKTEAPTGRYRFDTLIDDAIAVMDVLEIGRASFCGLSMGGATALGLAQRHPGRFDKVVVCDSPCASSQASAQQWEERIVVAREHGVAALVEPTLARWFPAETVQANPAFLDKIRKMIATTPLDGFVGCAAALADHDFRSGASRVMLPVLFLVGEKDGSVPDAMRQLHEQVRGSRFVELPGAGHISNMHKPKEFNRALAEFLG
jgi:3-oxoadipate enol-lactonase